MKGYKNKMPENQRERHQCSSRNQQARNKEWCFPAHKLLLDNVNSQKPPSVSTFFLPHCPFRPELQSSPQIFKYKLVLTNLLATCKWAEWQKSTMRAHSTKHLSSLLLPRWLNRSLYTELYKLLLQSFRREAEKCF